MNALLSMTRETEMERLLKPGSAQGHTQRSGWKDTPRVQTDTSAGIAAAPGLRLATGHFLAAGLTWEKPTVLSDLPQIGTARPRLKQGDRIARAEGLTIPSQAGSLLLALGAGLLDQLDPDDPSEGLWLFTAELDGSKPETASCWIALADLKRADDGWIFQPLPRAESLHDTRDAAVDAISEHMGTVDLAGIVIGAGQGTGDHTGEDPGPDGLAAALRRLPGPDPARIRQVGPRPEGLPVFTAPFHLPWHTAGIAGLIGAAVISATLILPQLVAAAFRAPPPPAPALISVAPAPGGFAEACVAGLSTWWPRITGWQAAGGGCALPRHLPPGPEVRIEPAQEGSLPVIIWHRLNRSGDANAVLAREAATRVLAGWPGGRSISADGILLWTTGTIPLMEVDPDALPTQSEETRARLAAIWAHLPNAVRAAETGGPDETAVEGGFIIQAPDAPADLFARAARVNGLEPVRLDLAGPSGGQGTAGPASTLHLAPVTPRLVPAPEKGPRKGPSP